MPRAVPLPQREQLVALRQTGLPLTQIAQTLALPYRTVRGLWRRYREQGAAGLPPAYARCGPAGGRFPAALAAAAVALKQAHPRWGGGLIRLQLRAQFPAQPLPSVRTLQRWFQAAGLQPARALRPAAPRERAQTPHEVWQIDATERLRLADGSGTSVLTVVDEASGALLGAVAFSPVSLDASPRRRGADGAARLVPAMGAAPAHPGG
jgi:hypothetical protein